MPLVATSAIRQGGVTVNAAKSLIITIYKLKPGHMQNFIFGQLELGTIFSVP